MQIRFADDKLRCVAIEALLRYALSQQPELFFRYWVLKESLGKTLGCELNKTVLRREFDLNQNAPVLKDQPELFFQEFSISSYRYVVCSQIPIVSEAIFICL